MKVSDVLKKELYSSLKEDDMNGDMLSITVDKSHDIIISELNNLYINGNEFDLLPFRHMRIVSISEERDSIEYLLAFDIPILIRGANDKNLFNKLNLDLFIKKNRF